MHLGIIPDGNRRYARENGIEKKEAYRRAKDVILDVFDDMERLPADIEEVTFFLLWENNLRRDSKELDALFKLLSNQIEATASQFNGNGFRFNWASTRPEALPEALRQKLRSLEKTHDSGGKKLNALISYSGKHDILQAARKLGENNEEFSEENLKDHLEVQRDIDYVIRTGDNPTREALSGFPIWNSSYAEYYHLKKHFPAVTTEDIIDALEHYKELRKRKGK